MLKGQGSVPAPPVLPEIQALLRMTLAPADARYKSSGDLRRELGKLLFSGPYSPSTFNLAYFLNDLFRDEIERETRARGREAGLDTTRPGAPSPERPPPAERAPAADRPAPRPAPPPPPQDPPPSRTVTAPRLHVEEPVRRGPAAAVIGIIAAAAVAGGIYLVARRPGPEKAAPQRAAAPVKPTPTLLPELQPTPAGPTTEMTEAQFRDEVSRRLAAEVHKLEAQMRDRDRPPAAALAGGPVTRVPYPTAAAPPEAPTVVVIVEAAPTAVPTPVAVAVVAERPTPAPVIARIREGALVPLEEVDSPPRLVGVVKPVYPPFALKARMGGMVLLRVLVSERGAAQEVEVLRRAPAGLTESAVEAVRRWTFSPATKGGVAVKTWMTVPIPFEP